MSSLELLTAANGGIMKHIIVFFLFAWVLWHQFLNDRRAYWYPGRPYSSETACETARTPIRKDPLHPGWDDFPGPIKKDQLDDDWTTRDIYCFDDTFDPRNLGPYDEWPGKVTLH